MFERIINWLSGTPHDVNCPNCGKKYNPLRCVEDWGVAIGDDLSVDLCAECLCNPERIDILRFTKMHIMRGTTQSNIDKAVARLQLLKKGELTSEQVGTGSDFM